MGAESTGEAGEIGDTNTNSNTNSDTNSDTNSNAVVMGAWDPSKLDKRTSVFVTLLGAENPENISPVSVELEPPLIMADVSSRATIRLGYTGPPASTAATLFIDDEEIASRAMSAESAEPLTFVVPPLAQGRHAARIELPDDNLPIDNTFHFMLKVEDQLPTLCVGSEDDVFFLRAALAAEIGGSGGIQVSVVAPQRPSARPTHRLLLHLSLQRGSARSQRDAGPGKICRHRRPARHLSRQPCYRVRTTQPHPVPARHPFVSIQSVGSEAIAAACSTGIKPATSRPPRSR